MSLLMIAILTSSLVGSRLMWQIRVYGLFRVNKQPGRYRKGAKNSLVVIPIIITFPFVQRQ